MPKTAHVNAEQFDRIAHRNIRLPLLVGATSALTFVLLLLYYISVTGWVDHTHQAIARFNGLTTLQADMQSGLGGYVAAGDDGALAPFQIARSQFDAQVAELTELTADNPPQSDRLRRIDVLQLEWERYAQQVIETKRNGGDSIGVTKALGGRQLFDRVRQDLVDGRGVEQGLLKDRLDTLNTVTWFGIGSYVLFIIIVNCWIAWAGRRDINQLSNDFGGALKAQTDAANVLSEQAWVRDGQAQLAETLIGQQTLTTVGRSVLSFAGRYLDPVVAAMYVRDDAGALQRVSTHGFQGVEDAMQLQAARDGLVGQALRDGRRALGASDKR